MPDEILFKGSYGVLAGIVSGIGAYFGIKTQIAVMMTQREADEKAKEKERTETAEFRDEVRASVKKLEDLTVSTLGKVVFTDTCKKCEKGNDSAIVSLRDTIKNLDLRFTQFMSDFTHRRGDHNG